MRVIITIFVLAGLTNAARAGCQGTIDPDPVARTLEHSSSNHTHAGARALRSAPERSVHTPP